jgi:hypothetical protein
MSDVTHFNKLSGIKGLYVRGRDNELLVVDENGNFYQTGVKVDLVKIEENVEEINSKLGESTDFWNGHKTVLGYSNSSYKHIHNSSYTYPDDCSLIDAVSSATANTFGNFAELIPANTVDVSFDIHWINVQGISANGTYILELHEVSADDLQVSEGFLGSISVSRQDNFTRSFQVYMQVPVIHANSRIGARVKKSGAGAGTVSFNVMYHDYE